MVVLVEQPEPWCTGLAQAPSSCLCTPLRFPSRMTLSTGGTFRVSCHRRRSAGEFTHLNEDGCSPSAPTDDGWRPSPGCPVVSSSSWQLPWLASRSHHVCAPMHGTAVHDCKVGTSPCTVHDRKVAPAHVGSQRRSHPQHFTAKLNRAHSGTWQLLPKHNRPTNSWRHCWGCQCHEALQQPGARLSPREWAAAWGLD